ncbi:hypothetical protein CCYA_CCYA05G1632 [Cyanidiococcus yangmingshanensis]|nr:hypothetical protein CCYA_CCYA05G1632 [Cyanidiococcus yangmingshanensis]
MHSSLLFVTLHFNGFLGKCNSNSVCGGHRSSLVTRTQPCRAVTYHPRGLCLWSQLPRGEPPSRRLDPAIIVVRYLDPFFNFGPETVFIVSEDRPTLYRLGAPPDSKSQWSATRKIYRARRVVSSVLALLLGLFWWPLSIVAAAAYSTFAVVATVVLFLAALVFGVVFWALGVAEERIERLMNP